MNTPTAQYRLAALLCLAFLSLTSLAQTRIMIISDTHVVAQDRQATTTNTGGKVDSCSYDILSKAAQDIIQAKPDLLLVCGDITYNGEASGHAAAHTILRTVVDAGIPVKVIPGNHDVLNAVNTTDGTYVTAAQFAAQYADMGYEDGVARDANSLSWAASINDKLAVIGLDANIYNGTTYYKDGCLRTSTLNWMKTQAAAFQAQGKMVIAMVHQELMNHFTKSATVYGMKMTVTQAQLAPDKILNINYKHNPTVTDENDVDYADVDTTALHQAFADAGISYVLTGHFHVHHIASKDVTKTDGTTAKLYDISTGGLTTYPCFIRTLLVNEDEGVVTNTSSLLQTQMNDTQDLQDVSKEKIADLDKEYASNSYVQMYNKLYPSTPFSIETYITQYMAMEPYELYDGTEVTHTNSFPTLSYTRTFSNDSWQALFVPFATKYYDWSENFEVALPDEASTKGIHFTTLTDDNADIPANTIALIRLREGSTTGSYTVNATSADIMPDASAATSLYDDGVTYSLNGTYSGVTGADMYTNGLYALGSGKLKTVASTVAGSTDIYVKPMRWTLGISGDSTAKPSSLSVFIDDDDIATEVSLPAQSLATGNAKAYRLDGTTATGSDNIIITNGKKIAR